MGRLPMGHEVKLNYIARHPRFYVMIWPLVILLKLDVLFLELSIISTTSLLCMLFSLLGISIVLPHPIPSPLVEHLTKIPFHPWNLRSGVTSSEKPPDVSFPTSPLPANLCFCTITVCLHVCFSNEPWAPWDLKPCLIYLWIPSADVTYGDA